MKVIYENISADTLLNGSIRATLFDDNSEEICWAVGYSRAEAKKNAEDIAAIIWLGENAPDYVTRYLDSWMVS